MLRIIYGNYDKAVFDTEGYFQWKFAISNDYSWLQDELIQKMIKDIDKSEVKGGCLIESPVFGMMPPAMLSGGVKVLIMMRLRPDLILNASNCGDNCAKWILELAKDRDITINLRHEMWFGYDEFEIYIVNTGEVVHNEAELLKRTHDLIREGYKD